MDENLNAPQEGMNPELEEVEVPSEPSIEELKAELERERQAKSEILARAKKAEAQVKEQKPSTTNTISDEDVDAKILKSQGLSDELIGEMKALAKVRGKPLLEMKNDPIIIAMQEAKEAEERVAKARLPASRNSSTQKKEKTVNSPGLSDEEHKALWRESQNK